MTNTNTNTNTKKEIRLLRKQADMMDMAQLYGIDDWRKLVMVRDFDSSDIGDFIPAIWHPAVALADWNQHKFALAVVEGKTVFEGDEFYSPAGHICSAGNMGNPPTWDDTKYWNSCTWNPPKPATVTVEMSRELAERIICTNKPAMIVAFEDFIEVAELCKAALEQEQGK